MGNNNDYKGFITELIKRQVVILGPDVALLKARNIEGLSINGEGEVVGFKGNPRKISQELVDEYISLSGQIFKSVVIPLLKKYPGVIVNTVQ